MKQAWLEAALRPVTKDMPDGVATAVSKNPLGHLLAGPITVSRVRCNEGGCIREALLDEKNVEVLCDCLYGALPCVM
jgi:hypothetical protein